MDEILTRAERAAEPSPELWKSVPLEVAMSVAAILLAAALKLVGVMP
jgi:hypothetical protein